MSPPTATWPSSVVLETLPPWMPAFSAGVPFLHALYERTTLGGQIERGERAIDRQGGEPKVAAADGAALLELGISALRC